MNAQSRLFTSFMVLCVFSQASWVQGQVFPRVRFLKTIGDKTNEIKAHLIVTEGSIQVRNAQSARTLKEIPYSEIKAATYSFSKHRRWRAGVAAAVAVNVFAEEERIRGERRESYSEIDYEALNDLLYAPNRFETPSAPPSQPDSAQPSPQSSAQPGAGRSLMGSEGEPSLLSRSASEILEGLRGVMEMRKTLTLFCLLIVTASFARAQTSMELREWISGYVEDLPNFVCDYTEKEYGPGRWNYWSLKKEHSGKVRFIDGTDEYQVLSVDGQPAKSPIWKVSRWHDPFGSIQYKLSPVANYRFTPKKKGKYTFLSDWGIGFFKGYTEDGKPNPETQRSYPTWGTLWVERSSHEVVKIEEHVKVPRGQPFDHGEHVQVTEYALTSIEGTPYRLPTRFKWEKKESYATPLGLMDTMAHYRVVQTYDNCKRYGADSVIHYEEVDSSIGYGVPVDAPN